MYYDNYIQNKDILIVGLLLLIPIFLLVILLLIRNIQEKIVMSYKITLVNNKGRIKLKVQGSYSFIDMKILSVDGAHEYSYIVDVLNNSIKETSNINHTIEIDSKTEIHGNDLYFILERKNNPAIKKSILSDILIIDLHIQNRFINL